MYPTADVGVPNLLQSSLRERAKNTSEQLEDLARGSLDYQLVDEETVQERWRHPYLQQGEVDALVMWNTLHKCSSSNGVRFSPTNKH